MSILDILMVILRIFMILVGVGLLIFVHEFGHFIVAKWARIKVEVFSLGFGQAIFKFRKGETEYRLSWIPLGGYVKMAGESHLSEESTGAPYEFISKPPLTRIKVFAAGALMNFLFAFPLCIGVYLLGIDFPYPSVGQVMPGSAEAQAGMKPGDIIVSVDQVPIKTMDKYRTKIISVQAGTAVPVAVLRDGQEVILSLVSRGIKEQTFGIQVRANIIVQVEKDSPAARAGLKVGDEIMAINDDRVYSSADLKKIRDNPGQKLNFDIRHSDKTMVSYQITPVLTDYYDLEIDENMLTPILKVAPNGPADKGGMKDGDKIVRINDQSIVSWRQLVAVVQANPEQSLKVVVERHGQETVLPSVIPEQDDNGLGYFQIELTAIVGEVTSGSPLDEAGLQTGDEVLKVNGMKINSLLEIQPIMTIKKLKQLELEIERNGSRHILNVEPRLKKQGGIGIGSILNPKMRLQKYPLTKIHKAIAAGVKETLDLTVLTFKLFKKVFSKKERGALKRGVSGPVGIAYFSYKIVESGVSRFLWILALFSINLAILNLLPIPILDGGGILFTVIEKIKGSPISVKVQIISQYIGLAMLLSLLLLATYNDVFYNIWKF